ncbi:MAG TPA: hypothetical protein GXX18_04200 [Bacillales bacterium]|nr:hypothetical protein [Bacillales bacterium]
MSSFKQVRPGTYEFRVELGYDSAGKRIKLCCYTSKTKKLDSDAGNAFLKVRNEAKI